MFCIKITSVEEYEYFKDIMSTNEMFTEYDYKFETNDRKF